MSFDTDQAILDINPPFYFVAGRVVSYTTTSFDGVSFNISLDLQEPLCETVKNFVKSKWPPQSMLGSDEIKFGTKIFDDYGSYQMHFCDMAVPEIPISIGWQYTYFAHIIEAYIYVRRNLNTQPPELDDMKRSLAYVIRTNRASLPITMPYSNFMRILDMHTIQPTDPFESLWTAVAHIEVRYFKATSN